MKDQLDLLTEFMEDGCVTHDCPICGTECEPTEIDSDEAWCPECDEVVKVERLL